jgi:hypothetical protein
VLPPRFVGGSTRTGVVPSRSTRNSVRAVPPPLPSFHRNTSARESGDQTGDTGDTPSSDGDAVMRSMVSGVRDCCAGSAVPALHDAASNTVTDVRLILWCMGEPERVGLQPPVPSIVNGTVVDKM